MIGFYNREVVFSVWYELNVSI